MSLSGKKVENAPQALTVYELCKTFSCLPSQLDEQSNKDIEELLIVHNTIAKHDSKGNKKARREELKNKMGGGTPRG